MKVTSFLKCSIYDQARTEFFNVLRSWVTFNLSNDEDQCFILLMNNLNGDSELAPLVCEFVNICFDLRKNYLGPLEIMNDKEKSATCTRFGRLSKPCNRLIETID